MISIYHQIGNLRWHYKVLVLLLFCCFVIFNFGLVCGLGAGLILIQKIAHLILELLLQVRGWHEEGGLDNRLIDQTWFVLDGFLHHVVGDCFGVLVY